RITSNEGREGGLGFCPVLVQNQLVGSLVGGFGGVLGERGAQSQEQDEEHPSARAPFRKVIHRSVSFVHTAGPAGVRAAGCAGCGDVGESRRPICSTWILKRMALRSTPLCSISMPGTSCSDSMAAIWSRIT